MLEEVAQVWFAWIRGGHFRWRWWRGNAGMVREDKTQMEVEVE